MRRTEPDTIYIPPPPPDTVLVGDPSGTAAAEYVGQPASVCLATGQNVSIKITSSGDTLVGTPPVPIRSVRPAMTFAGTYAGSAFWYLDDEEIVFEGGDFVKSEDTFPVDCNQILRVGVFRGGPRVCGGQREAPARGDLYSRATRRLASVRAWLETLTDVVLADDSLLQNAIAGVEHRLHRRCRQVFLSLAGGGP